MHHENEVGYDQRERPFKWSLEQPDSLLVSVGSLFHRCEARTANTSSDAVGVYSMESPDMMERSWMGDAFPERNQSSVLLRLSSTTRDVGYR